MKLRGIKNPFASKPKAKEHSSAPSQSGKTDKGRLVQTAPAKLPHNCQIRTAAPNTKAVAQRQVSMPNELKALMRQNQMPVKPSTFSQLEKFGRSINPHKDEALKEIKGFAREVSKEFKKKNISLEQVFRIQSIITGKLLNIAKNPNKVDELNDALITNLVGPEKGKDVIAQMNKTKDENLAARLLNLKLPDVPN